MVDRSLVVVGSGPGVSASVARRFAREGCAVGLVGLDPAPLAELAEELRAARAAAEGTPLDALGALAAAYVRFSRTRPAYFRLMFRPELSQPDKHPEAAAAGDAAFGVLAEAIGDCVAAGQLPADKADTLGITWWAVGHGLASLWLDGQLGKRSAQLGTTAPELTDDVLATLVRLLRPHP